MNQFGKMKLLAIAATLGVLMLPAGSKAEDREHHREHCSNATLHGSYGLHATGITAGGGNFAAVGRFNFDGKGNLTGALFVRVDGGNGELSITGIYSVSSDCIVDDTWNYSGGSSTHKSIIVKEGKEYFILNDSSDDGMSVISGEAKKQ